MKRQNVFGFILAVYFIQKVQSSDVRTCDTLEGILQKHPTKKNALLLTNGLQNSSQSQLTLSLNLEEQLYNATCDVRHRIWTFLHIGTGSNLIRVTQSRTINEKVQEFVFNWRMVADGKVPICFSSNKSAESYWYPTYLNVDHEMNFPMTDFKIDGSKPFIGAKGQFEPIMENLFLNSNGFLLYLDELHPWYVQYNTSKGLCLNLNNKVEYQREIEDFSEHYSTMKFRILVGENVKSVYQSALNDFGYIRRPVQKPADFGSKSITFNLANQRISDSITEIKDSIDLLADLFAKKHFGAWERISVFLSEPTQWQRVPGDFAFDPEKFPNAKLLIHTLKGNGSSLSVQFGPAIEKMSKFFGEAKPYQINPTQSIFQIDFSNPSAVEWFLSKIHKFQTANSVELVRFSFGDLTNTIDYTGKNKQQSVCDQLVLKYPNLWITHYANSVAQLPDSALDFGFKTQPIPVFVRLIIPASREPIQQLISSALTLSLAGYQFFVPELRIGKPDVEKKSDAAIRWIQALTFMPAFEIPFSKSLFTEAGMKVFDACSQIRKTLVTVHLNSLANEWIDPTKPAEPIIRPMWWADPNDPNLLAVRDQFMLGPDIVVAPVEYDPTLQPRTANSGSGSNPLDLQQPSRQVYLPNGPWIDQNGKEFHGPQLIDVSATIFDLPYFVRGK